MLDLEVQPERSLGNEQWEFVLGMPFYQAVHILKKQDRVIKGVQVWYSDQNPLLNDLVLHLTQDGLRLVFDSTSQRLKVIEVYNMTRVKLKYCGVHFNASHIQPSIEQIDQSFGATHPGVYHSEKQLFMLNFRGLSFEFPIESKLEPRYAHGMGSLQFAKSPIVGKMHIYTGNSLEDTKAPLLPLHCFHGNCYLDKLEVVREHNVTKELKFTLIMEGNGVSKLSEFRRITAEKSIKFGDSCEDVQSALGSPSKIHYKAEDKMRIHRPRGQRSTAAQCSDYFYNYITLGLDVLFDGARHSVKKFILHTNLPGHYDFNMYYRCELHMVVSGRKSHDGAPCPPNININFDTKWSTIQDRLVCPPSHKPVVLKRASTTNTTNPFGSTFCFGVQDFIIEVMQNDHIASITLYQTPPLPLS